MLGPRSPSSFSSLFLLFSLSLSLSYCNLSVFMYPSLSSVISFRPVLPSFVFLLTLRRLSRSTFCLPLAFSLFLSLVAEDLLTRGLRVSRRALWWLLRWLLASLESSQESVLPPRVKELPREQVHLLLRPSPPLLLLHFRPSCRTVLRTAANPPYAPSGSYLRVLLIFSYYRRGHVGTFHAHTRGYGLVRTRDTVHLEVHRSPLLSFPVSARTQRRSPCSSRPSTTSPRLGAPLRYSNM